MLKKSKMWRTTTAATTLLAAAALVLTGCSAAADSTEGQAPVGDPIVGGTLTVAVNDDPRSLDTVALPGVTAAMISEMVFEQLFALDADNNAQPMLVDEWQVSDDQQTYTFKLREGITFHDGTPLTSADVVASLDYWMRTAEPGKLVANDVADVSADGDLTVSIQLNQPRYPLLSELAGPGPIIMKQATAEAGTPQGFLPEAAIGTGPYQVAEWSAGQQIVLDRFEDYQSRTETDWGGMAGAKPAYLDSIVYKIVTDEDARINGLLTDQWQHVMPSDNQYDVLKANPDLTVNTLFGGNPNVFVPNFNEASVFSKVEAREALSLLMDREALAAAAGASPDIAMMDGSYVTADNVPMHSTVGTDVYETHDVEKAKKLFAKAGLNEGDTVRILTSSTFPQFMQWSVELQEEFKEIGINVVIDSYDFTTTLGMLTEQPESWDIGTFFFNGALTSPEQIPALTLGGLNGSGSEKMTQLLADYNASSDEAEAKAVVDEMHAEVWNEYPVVAINASRLWAAYSPDLQGYDDYRRIFWNAWLQK